MPEAKTMYKTNDLRTRLESCLDTVIRDPHTQELLSPDGDVPSHCLQENNITLTRHEFNKTAHSAANNLNLDPPSFMRSLSSGTFQEASHRARPI